MEGLLITLLSMSLFQERAMGIQLGQCHTYESEYSLCKESPIVRGYLRAAHRIGRRSYITALTEHHSHFDGKADITGDEDRQTGYQNGTFVGYEYRF